MNTISSSIDRWLVLAAFAAGAPGAPAAARAQDLYTSDGRAQVVEAGDVIQRSTPWLPSDHWTRPLLVRLHALGATAHDPVVTERTLREVAEALSDRGRSRLLEEGRQPDAAPAVRPELGARVRARSGALRPGGFTLDRAWTGPRETPDATAGALAARLEGAPRDWLAFTLAAEASPDSAALDHATLDLASSRWALWAGRRRLGWSPGEGGGLVLTLLDRFDGAGLRTTRPRSLPLVGPVSGSVFGGPMGRNGHVDRAWLVGMRAHVRPHARLDIGVTRVAVFGGMGGARLGARQLVEVLVGANLDGDYADDQVASIDARWRPQTPVPLELYGEWGMHDIDAGVLVDMPSFTVGLRLPRLPGFPAAGASLEHTRISASCCGNPPWYQHFELADGWTADGTLMGHPLGGHGHQWRLGVSGDARAAAFVFDAAAILRNRGAENLFWPDHEGRAAALELGADARIGPRASGAFRLFVEGGEDWTEVKGRLVGRFWL